MDRPDRLDASDEDQAGVENPAEPRRRRSPHPSWVKLVAVGIIVLVVLATFVSALL